jgi:hypothetical protein
MPSEIPTLFFPGFDDRITRLQSSANQYPPVEIDPGAGRKCNFNDAKNPSPFFTGGKKT